MKDELIKMRQKADKLEKGKWYADSMYEGQEAFLKFDKQIKNDFIFSEQKGDIHYCSDIDGKVPFLGKPDTFHVTEEDIERYKLDESDKEGITKKLLCDER